MQVSKARTHDASQDKTIGFHLHKLRVFMAVAWKLLHMNSSHAPANALPRHHAEKYFGPRIALSRIKEI